MFPTRFLNLEHLSYDTALELMRGLVEIKRRSNGPEVLILVEHEPILTMGRPAEASDILAEWPLSHARDSIQPTPAMDLNDPLLFDPKTPKCCS